MVENSWVIVVGLWAITLYLAADCMWLSGMSLALPVPPRTLFWILSLTWGIIQTILGAIVAAGYLIIGREHTTYRSAIWIYRNNAASAFSLGPFIFANDYTSEEILQHEFGHSVQNIWYGPFALLCVSIPSMVRFWWRQIFKITEPPYHSIWFEGQATNTGA